MARGVDEMQKALDSLQLKEFNNELYAHLSKRPEYETSDMYSSLRKRVDVDAAGPEVAFLRVEEFVRRRVRDALLDEARADRRAGGARARLQVRRRARQGAAARRRARGRVARRRRVL